MLLTCITRRTCNNEPANPYSPHWTKQWAPRNFACNGPITRFRIRELRHKYTAVPCRQIGNHDEHGKSNNPAYCDNILKETCGMVRYHCYKVWLNSISDNDQVQNNKHISKDESCIRDIIINIFLISIQNNQLINRFNIYIGS